MNRYTTPAGTIINSLRRLRLQRLRKALSLMLSLTLIFVPLPGGITGGSKAMAQEIIICGGTSGSRTRVIQNCDLAGSDSVALESQVIADLLMAHQLPASDASRLLDWERNLVRAALFNRLAGFAEKPLLSLTPSQQSLITKLASLVKEKRILSATKALDEYNRWASLPCGFVAPPGFVYTIPCACFSQVCALLGGPLPPSLEEFQNYGASIAYRDFNDKPELQAIAGDTARQVGILAGFGAVGLGALIGGAVGAAVGASIYSVALQAYLLASLLDGAAGTIPPTVAAGSTGAALTGAATFAAVAAIVVLATVIAVFEGIAVVNASQIPGKLQESKNNAINANIDLTQVL
ncbi:MAG: hypothetical protein ABI882_23495, partial [Acidobacteriota bacterium]